jgi:biopolymer transport protein ExbD
VNHDRPSLWDIDNLHTRYVPQTPLGSGLLISAPWLNFVLLIIFFIALPADYVNEPGLVLQLPEMPFRSGARYGPAAVVMTIDDPRDGTRREVVFFDDQPYPVTSEKHRRALRTALRHARTTSPDMSLTIVADKRTSHGTITDLCNIAMDVGIQRVTLAARRTREGGAP